MKSVAVLLTTLALTGPALAGGPIAVAPEPMVAAPMAPVMTSTDWTGFYVGAQIGYANIDSNGSSLDGDGVLGGVHAGYRYDFGRYVAGAELDYDVADIDLGAVDGNTLENVARLKLMGGYEFGRSLVYATAGAAQASARVNGDDLSDNGMFYGAGLDVAVNDRISVGGEVLQHNFDDFDGSGVDLDATTVTARVSLRF